MASGVRKDYHGAVWPLGLIGNSPQITPGTPVGIMSLVDPNSVNDPNQTTTTGSNEFTVRAQQIEFQAFKAAAHGLQNNTGNIYIIKRGGSGSANRDDYGTIITCLTPGQTFFLASAPLNRNVFSPYDYQIDCDSAGDSCLVSLIIQ